MLFLTQGREITFLMHIRDNAQETQD